MEVGCRATCSAIHRVRNIRVTRTNVGNVTDEERARKVMLAELGALAGRAADAGRSEREAFEVRDSAVVAAVRAGASLDQIGEAAGVTKAAASAIARKTLAARPGRGGPYRRRRGVDIAIRAVDQAATRVTAAARRRRLAIAERDRMTVAAADEGIPIRSIAEALGMDTKVVYTLIRRCRRKAMQEAIGALASSSSEGLKADNSV